MWPWAEIVVPEGNESIQLGAWSVRRRLGRGGMGTVYHCHNPLVPGIEAAVKTMDSSLSRSVSSRKRFIREAEVLFSLDHPHIVKVRNLQMDHSPPFLEMDFVAGNSLGGILAAGSLTRGAATSLAAQMSSAVHYLHGRGVFHRDIKPDNIIMSGERATLVDFGLVSEDHQATLNRPGALFGTLQYVPPEWGGGSRPNGAAWDRYSLGVVIYEAFTGRNAFERPASGSFLDVLTAVQDEKRSRACIDPGPSAPDEVRRLVRVLTARAPEQRMVDLADIADRLVQVRGAMGDAEVSLSASAQFASARSGSGSDTWNSMVDVGGHGGAPTAVPDLDSFAADLPGLSSDGASTLDTDEQPSRHNPTLVPSLTIDRTVSGLEIEVPAPEPVQNRRPLVVGSLVAAAAAVVVVAVLLSDTEPEVTSTVPAEFALELQGVPDELPVPFAVFLDGTKVALDALPPVAAGNHTLVFVLGGGCDPAQPGPHCGVKSQGLTVGEDGTGARRRVTFPDVVRRPVQLASAGDPFRLRWADQSWTDVQGEHTVDAQLPGVYATVVQAGACPEEPCGDACPEGCAEAVREVVVPFEGSEPVQVSFEIRAPARPAAAPVKAASSGARRSPGRVTVGRFARWLASHREYQRDGSAGGQQGKQYLKGWSKATPPAMRPGRTITQNSTMMDVSPAVAEVYCRGRGGLLPVHAEPRSWDVSDNDTPMFEYRRGTDGPVWLDSTGIFESTQRNEVTRNAGFRCVK